MAQSVRPLSGFLAVSNSRYTFFTVLADYCWLGGSLSKAPQKMTSRWVQFQKDIQFWGVRRSQHILGLSLRELTKLSRLLSGGIDLCLWVLSKKYLATARSSGLIGQNSVCFHLLAGARSLEAYAVALYFVKHLTEMCKVLGPEGGKQRIGSDGTRCLF